MADIGKDGTYPGLDTLKQGWEGGWSLDVEVSTLLRATHAAEAFAKAGDSFRYRLEAEVIAAKIEKLQIVAKAIRAEQGEG